jgi:hypothetical protein
MKRLLTVLVCSLAFAGAMAQSGPPSVGAVQNVNGLVTISKGNTMSNGVDGAPLTNGTQLVTGAESSVLVRLTNGCVFTVPANSSVVINNQIPCADLIASIQPVGGPVVAAGGVEAGQVAFGFGVALAAMQLLSGR